MTDPDGLGVPDMPVSLENYRTGATELFETFRAVTGAGKRDHIYRFTMPAVNPQSTYTLQVRMQSEGSVSSIGKIYFTKLASNPR